MEIFHHNLKDNPSISIRYTKSKNLDQAKKVLFLLQGRSEWLEKFTTLIESLDLAEDVAWATWDHRGQGGSGGKPSHIEDYSEFASDTAEMVELLSQGRPYSFVCHSMGGLIARAALRYLQYYKCTIAS